MKKISTFELFKLISVLIYSMLLLAAVSQRAPSTMIITTKGITSILINFLTIALATPAIAGCALFYSSPKNTATSSNFSSEKVLLIPSSKPEIQFNTTVFMPSRPQLSQTSPIVIINHGSSAETRKDRYRPMAAVEFFTGQGWPVVIPMRSGYAGSGGKEIVSDVMGLEKYGLENATDIQDAVNWTQTVPELKSRPIIMVGQSTGGLATMAYSSLGNKNVIAVINFHGGSRPSGPNDPKWQGRIDAFNAYAGKSRPKSLWIYTENDRSSNPVYIKRLYDEFVAHQGSAELHQLPKFREDGHFLFTEGPEIWIPIVSEYLKKMGVM